jgi:hypothetical protein
MQARALPIGDIHECSLVWQLRDRQVGDSPARDGAAQLSKESSGTPACDKLCVFPHGANAALRVHPFGRPA